MLLLVLKRIVMSKRRWTKDEEAFMVANYDHTTASDIGAFLGRSVRSIYSRAQVLGLHTTIEHMREVGREKAQHPNSVARRFKPGHVPENKGKKVSAEVYAKCKPTMFRKGNIPHNYRPVGSECLRDDGYVWVKIADPNKWVQKQRAVWMEHHGEIPKGYNVQFRNKDRMDFRIENLYLISKADQMKNENSLIASYPKPLADLIRLKGVVNRQIHKQERLMRNGK